MAVPRICIITPMYNEEACFAAYIEAVERVLLSRTDAHYSVLLVDDGSKDRTWELMQTRCRTSSRYRALRLSRNFGAHAAETAGLDCCDADAVAMLSADLQDPPETILEFVDAWRHGAEVVWGHRRTRADANERVWASELFAALLRRFAMPRDSKFATGGFLLIDRKVVECVRQLREHSRLTFGLVAWTGFRQDVVYYDRRARIAGKSGWSFGRMIVAMYDALVGFSTAVPRLVTVVGLTFSLIGTVAAAYFVFNALFGRPSVGGWSAIMVTLTLFFGITFFILGTICEYLLRIYREVVQRPLYFVAADTAEPDLSANRPAELLRALA
jgi:glycosyltransferase involved in cell wall biosynthesis